MVEELIADVLDGRENAWRALVEQLYPQIEAIVGASRSMGSLRSEDDRKNAATLALSKLERNAYGALRLHGAWRQANPEKTFDDWLRIVVTNVVRDYVVSQHGTPPGDVPLAADFSGG